MAKKRTKREIYKGPEFPVVVETFRDYGHYELSNIAESAWREPSCYNGRVCVRRFRVTVEVIDEPAEVIGSRLQKLWDECDNHHHVEPLIYAAEKYGVELVGQYGSKRKRT